MAAVEALPNVLDARGVLALEPGAHGFAEGDGRLGDEPICFAPAGDAGIGLDAHVEFANVKHANVGDLEVGALVDDGGGGVLSTGVFLGHPEAKRRCGAKA